MVQVPMQITHLAPQSCAFKLGFGGHSLQLAYAVTVERSWSAVSPVHTARKEKTPHCCQLHDLDEFDSIGGALH